MPVQAPSTRLPAQTWVNQEPATRPGGGLTRGKGWRCWTKPVRGGNGAPAPDRGEDDEGWAGGMALTSDPVPATAEHGRGLKIIKAVVDNLQLTGSERGGTTVHFEKTLEWLPGAAGQHLFSVDGGGEAQPGLAGGRNQ